MSLFTEPMTDDRARRIAFALVLALTALRLLALFSSPLELYPDEAQYWLWSRTLSFGYFSKPPMIAWLIWATTSIGGDAEAWIRVSAPLLHAGSALCLFFIGRRLFGSQCGLAATALYALMPGVALSSGVMSTDAPLLFFLALMLWAYVELPTATGRRGVALSAGMGAALGLAMLSKYAAIYALGGVILHALVSREARSVWSPVAVVAFALALLAAITPNIAWNAAHQFSTVEHTAANANLGSSRLFDPAELGSFLLSQFGVFGPLPFAVLVGGMVLLIARRRLTAQDVLLLCFCLPPLLVVSIQGFISRANANWAAAGYLAGCLLVAAWMLRWNARLWLIAGLGVQAVIAALFLTWTIAPRTADAMGVSNSFKRARGWEQSVDAVVQRAMQEGGSATLSAVAVDDRFLFNAAAYYGRDYFGQADAPPLRMWVHEIRARNQAETEAPLTAKDGQRVLAASLDGVYRAKMGADFREVSGKEIARVRLDAKRTRKIDMFVGEGFAPVARDPATGKPPEPEVFR
ncbi:ArnT family glycosyltransferase [Caulobacter sp. NIBR2454]|uniref:ArnT family glycosyltransferase n=1 Tax=Caulobacter sp. NIBR2454 TaxID=3015996 RepID=UPI0022B635C1|nr:glycosyltransferase family 39 protein [Caulobacter sp. NIBR2454]